MSTPSLGEPRASVTSPVSPTEQYSDTLLYEDPRDAQKKLYLPRYRIAEQTVSGAPQYRIAVEAKGAAWALTIHFEKFPAPEIEIPARTASEIPHQVSVLLRFHLMMNGSAAGDKELAFDDVAFDSQGLRASLGISTIEQRDQVYQALTESVFSAFLVLRRVAKLALPLTPPPDVGAFILSSGNAVLAPGTSFDFDTGTPQSDASVDVAYTSDGDSRKLTPQSPSQIANLGIGNFTELTPDQLKSAPYSSQALQALLNADAQSVLIVTPNWNPPGLGGIYETHTLGIWYTGHDWSVFNQDFAPMALNAAFNVLALPPGASAFVHHAVGPIPIWGDWIKLGLSWGGFKGSPTTVSRNPAACNVYVQGNDNALWQKAWYDGKWNDFARHDDGGLLSAAPSAGTMGPNQEHVYVRGADGSVFGKAWNAGSGWSPWVNLGAPPGGFHDSPAVISRGPDVINVYVWGMDNALWQNAWYGGSWHGWSRHDESSIASVPALASQSANHEEVFARDLNGNLAHKMWVAGSGWSAWTTLLAPPGGFQGNPAAIYRGTTEGDVFVRGLDNNLWRRKFEIGVWKEWVWKDWERLSDGGNLVSDPAAGSMGPNQEQVFVKGSDGQVWQKLWPGGTNPGNISGNSTFLDHPAANGNPAVIITVTPIWNPGGQGGIYNAHNIGVWLSGNWWGIFNQDMTAIPPGAGFNVHITQPGPNAYVHRASPANISGHVTVLDHPLANGNPNAIVTVTAVWNPGGSGGVYVNHPIGVYYDGAHWAIFNQDIQPMPQAAFNIEVCAPSTSAFTHRAVASNISGHTSVITLPNSADNQLVAGDLFAVQTSDGNRAKVLVVEHAASLKVQWVTYSGSPRYHEETVSLDATGLRDPFVFPPNLYAYIFQGINDVSGEHRGLIRQTVDWKTVPQVYLQDQAQQNTFYYLPDAFKIARRTDSPRSPFLSVQFNSPDGALEHTTVVVEYFAVPFVDRDRLKSASVALKAFVSSGAGDPVLQLLLSNQLRFQLGLTQSGSGGSVAFVDRPEALVSLRDGIHHSISFSIQDFQAIFDALFSGTASLFQGQVRVSLGDNSGDDVPAVPFIARMNDLIGDLFDHSAVPGSTDGTLQVTLKNAIESPITVHRLDAALRREPNQTPALVAGPTFPMDVPAGGSILVNVTAAVPPAGAGPLTAVFDLSGVEVKPDREAIWNAVLKQTVSPEYIRTITVQAPGALFDAPADHSMPAIDLLKIDLHRGSARAVAAELDASHLTVKIGLPAPLGDFILGKPDEGTYTYQVTAVRHGQGSVGSKKTSSGDLLLLLTADLA